MWGSRINPWSGSDITTAQTQGQEDASSMAHGSKMSEVFGIGRNSVSGSSSCMSKAWVSTFCQHYSWHAYILNRHKHEEGHLLWVFLSRCHVPSMCSYHLVLFRDRCGHVLRSTHDDSPVLELRTSLNSESPFSRSTHIADHRLRVHGYESTLDSSDHLWSAPNHAKLGPVTRHIRCGIDIHIRRSVSIKPPGFGIMLTLSLHGPSLPHLSYWLHNCLRSMAAEKIATTPSLATEPSRWSNSRTRPNDSSNWPRYVLLRTRKTIRYAKPIYMERTTSLTPSLFQFRRCCVSSRVREADDCAE